MTPTETVLQAIQRLEGEEQRLEHAVRDARHALENSSPGHALVILERALRTKEVVK